MKTSARLGRRRSTSMSKVRSPARAQVAARLSAVVLLPSPALALVTRSVTIGPRLSADPQQAGPDVAIGVGLDRIGRAGRPEVPAPMRQRGPPDPRHHAQERQASVRASRARAPSPSGRCTRAGRPARSPGRCSRTGPTPINIGLFGLIGTVGSTTFAGIRTQSLLIKCCCTIPNSISLSCSRDLLRLFLAIPEQRQHSLVFGHRLLQLGQQLVVLFPVGVELSAVLLEDHLSRADGLPGLDRAQLFDLVEHGFKSLGPLLRGGVVVEVTRGVLYVIEVALVLAFFRLELREPALAAAVGSADLELGKICEAIIC